MPKPNLLVAILNCSSWRSVIDDAYKSFCDDGLDDHLIYVAEAPLSAEAEPCVEELKERKFGRQIELLVGAPDNSTESFRDRLLQKYPGAAIRYFPLPRVQPKLVDDPRFSGLMGA